MKRILCTTALAMLAGCSGGGGSEQASTAAAPAASAEATSAATTPPAPVAPAAPSGPSLTNFGGVDLTAGLQATGGPPTWSLAISGDGAAVFSTANMPDRRFHMSRPTIAGNVVTSRGEPETPPFDMQLTLTAEPCSQGGATGPLKATAIIAGAYFNGCAGPAASAGASTPAAP